MLNSDQKDAKLDPEVSDLHFRLLGPLEAERGGVMLELGPRKQRAVLALLLLDANRVVSAERLIDDLWGESPPETARSALQVYVAGLRKALGGRRMLRTAAPGYVLEMEPGRSISTASRRCAPKLAPPPTARAAELSTALGALAGGAPGRARQRAVRARGRGAARATAPRRPAGANRRRPRARRDAQLLPELNGLVAEHPYHEPFRAQLMLALYRRGGRPMLSRPTARRARPSGTGSGRARAGAQGARAAVLEQDPGSARRPRPGPETRRSVEDARCDRGRRWAVVVGAAV